MHRMWRHLLPTLLLHWQAAAAVVTAAAVVAAAPLTIPNFAAKPPPIKPAIRRKKARLSKFMPMLLPNPLESRFLQEAEAVNKFDRQKPKFRVFPVTAFSKLHVATPDATSVGEH